MYVDQGVQLVQPEEMTYMAAAFLAAFWFAIESRSEPVLRSDRRPRICHRPADQSQTGVISVTSPWAPGLPPDSAMAIAVATGATFTAHPCSSARVAMPAGVSVPAEPW